MNRTHWRRGVSGGSERPFVSPNLWSSHHCRN